MVDDIFVVLYYVVDKNDVMKLCFLFFEGVDLNENYNDSFVLLFIILYLCCGKGYLEFIWVLVEVGVNIKLCDVWVMILFVYSIIF